MSTKNIIKIAITTAKGSCNEFKFSAVLYRGGSILKVAKNSSKSIGYRWDLFEYEPTRHAEINVLHNIPRDVLKECGILVVRVDAMGNLTSAKPCRACLRAIQLSEISKLHFSTYSGEIEKVNPLMIDIDEWNKERPICLR
jgi:tRNA(Arg) A34 adenosine deaminase TadA